jgi:hypothetical protein
VKAGWAKSGITMGTYRGNREEVGVLFGESSAYSCIGSCVSRL